MATLINYTCKSFIKLTSGSLPGRPINIRGESDAFALESTPFFELSQFTSTLTGRSKGVFTWEKSHRRESHTGMTFWFRIGFTLWLSHLISRYLKVHFMLIKYTCDSKSQTFHMRYPFRSTGRPISHRDGWSFRVYMIPLRDFEPEWNSRPGTRTGETRAGMTFCGGIM